LEGLGGYWSLWRRWLNYDTKINFAILLE